MEKRKEGVYLREGELAADGEIHPNLGNLERPAACFWSNVFANKLWYIITYSTCFYTYLYSFCSLSLNVRSLCLYDVDFAKFHHLILLPRCFCAETAVTFYYFFAFGSCCSSITKTKKDYFYSGRRRQLAETINHYCRRHCNDDLRHACLQQTLSLCMLGLTRQPIKGSRFSLFLWYGRDGWHICTIISRRNVGFPVTCAEYYLGQYLHATSGESASSRAQLPHGSTHKPL